MYTLAAFAFGVAFVIVLLTFAIAYPEPSNFQIFVFRTVLALAAAGVAAVIPGMLNLQIGTWLTATGAIAVFAIVFLVNPPALVSQTKVSALQDRATLALLSGNYGFAKTLFEKAISLAPNDPGPIFSLANANFKAGDFLTAERLYLEAYHRSGDNDLNRDKIMLYNISLIREAEDDFDGAIQNYENIGNSQPPSSAISLDIIFSEGQLYLKKALRDLRDESSLGNARDNFNAFVEGGGKPLHWAHYHLACVFALYATKSIDQTDREKNEGIAMEDISKSVDELKSFRGGTAQTHYDMLKHLLQPDGFYAWMPGFPVECPPLRSLIQRANPRLISTL